jgi:DNA replicative helicase MCM subunit Mcm2 (Cdc46/Mcm family)
MDEKGFKSHEEIKEALETLKKKAEIIEPKNEHYRVI